MTLLSSMPEDSLVHGLLGRLAAEEAPKPQRRVSKLREQLMAASGGDVTRLRKAG